MRTLYLLDSPAARATRDASPVALPGVTGAPRLAARVRLARGTDAPDMGPSQDVIDAMAIVMRYTTTHGYVTLDDGSRILPPRGIL